ncbi:MAG: HD family phosphohydrolase, partial [Candidatus Roseilinea sp.]|uniref:HD family phosphohydrolase n=1 Tax=Candidatus Roseilinea sp. TaxID=2838777 RepID=UPI00404962CB
VLSALAVALIGSAMLHESNNTPAWSTIARRPQRTALSAVLLVAALFLARLLLPGHILLPFLAPLGAVSIAITSWCGPFAGITSAVALGGLAAIPLDSPLEIGLYYIAGGIMASLMVRRGERIGDYFRAGLAIAATHIAVVLAFHAGEVVDDASAARVGTLLAAALANSLLSAAIAPALLYIAGILFDIITPIQLIELSRPSHPLLQQLLTRAPGTYHHSLMVANLAEQAAERIGADSLLTRVGAYYHDIGKSLHPYFFIENQIDTGNVHDQLDPQTSSHILQNHVKDGVELAKRFRLPSRIVAFITEHHGTTRTSYQYALAAQADSEPVDEAGFRYPGPRPQSRETALVMLADGCEAAIRARKPTTPEETEAILRKVISERLADHQLDDVNLTLREMEHVRQSFLDTLRGAYHPRINYPEANRKADPTASLPDAIVPAPQQSLSDAGLALPREQPLKP